MGSFCILLINYHFEKDPRVVFCLHLSLQLSKYWIWTMYKEFFNIAFCFVIIIIITFKTRLEVWGAPTHQGEETGSRVRLSWCKLARSPEVRAAIISGGRKRRVYILTLRLMEPRQEHHKLQLPVWKLTDSTSVTEHKQVSMQTWVPCSGIILKRGQHKRSEKQKVRYGSK